MAKKFGDHVKFTPGAGEDPVVAHVLKDNGDTTLNLQVPDGKEYNIPHREASSEGEDLGRTWQDV